MSASMLVHDERVMGNSPHIADNTFLVNRAFTLDQILNWVSVFADKSHGISTLTILAHGAVDEHDQGGFGVSLGKEGIKLWTVQKFAVLRGKIGNIALISCQAARTAYGTKGGYGDGDLLCSKLAFYAGAPLIASTVDQEYQYGCLWHLDPNEIDLGDWELPLIQYDAHGNHMGIKK